MSGIIITQSDREKELDNFIEFNTGEKILSKKQQETLMNLLSESSNSDETSDGTKIVIQYEK